MTADVLAEIEADRAHTMVDARDALIARRLAGNPRPCALGHRATPPEEFAVALGGCRVCVGCLQELA
jgi:hypothetical protein